MKKILAVSGGIDSVVMLHLFKDDPDVIVAHFNHGIRPNSANDRDFVARIAQEYGLPFVYEDAELSPQTSEADARAARYQFLFAQCKTSGGKLFTAHHADDVIETIVINLIRGTGWRGLAPLRDTRIERPLLDWSKSDIYQYASKHQLSFRQDQTNTEDTYLRNRVRATLRNLPDSDRQALLKLYHRQCVLSEEITTILQHVSSVSNHQFSRSSLSQVDDTVAEEILREILRGAGISQTRPQIQRALEAIRTYQANKKFPLNQNAYLYITRYHFAIKKS